jgi:hypothetical protein
MIAEGIVYVRRSGQLVTLPTPTVRRAVRASHERGR